MSSKACTTLGKLFVNLTAKEPPRTKDSSETLRGSDAYKEKTAVRTSIGFSGKLICLETCEPLIPTLDTTVPWNRTALKNRYYAVTESIGTHRTLTHETSEDVPHGDTISSAANVCYTKNAFGKKIDTWDLERTLIPSCVGSSNGSPTFEKRTWEPCDSNCHCKSATCDTIL